MYSDFANKRADELVVQYAPLVKKIALHSMARLPASVQLDDLIQAGMMGLLEAAKKYEASKGASFETYAGIRIRGAMVDEVRKGDWVPRSVHRNARLIAEAIQIVEAREGRDARPEEIANELKMNIDEYFSCLMDTSSSRLFSLEDMVESSGDAHIPVKDGADASPEEKFDAFEFKQNLAAEIDHLPEREKLVLSLYYEEELNLKEIGAVLSVSESRVSQIHSQACARLRARMAQYD